MRPVPNLGHLRCSGEPSSPCPRGGSGHPIGSVHWVCACHLGLLMGPWMCPNDHIPPHLLPRPKRPPQFLFFMFLMFFSSCSTYSYPVITLHQYQSYTSISEHFSIFATAYEIDSCTVPYSFNMPELQLSVYMSNVDINQSYVGFIRCHVLCQAE